MCTSNKSAVQTLQNTNSITHANGVEVFNVNTVRFGFEEIAWFQSALMLNYRDVGVKSSTKSSKQFVMKTTESALPLSSLEQIEFAAETYKNYEFLVQTTPVVRLLRVRVKPLLTVTTL